MTIQLHLPRKLAAFKLPKGVERRLHALLDKQDAGTPLTKAERSEAEGLVEIVELLSYLKLRAEVTAKQTRL